jgi:hypothetical protein
MKTLCFKLLCFCLAFYMVERFCHKQTEGFKIANILSNLPYAPEREVSPLSPAEQKQVEAILAQPFTFLGSGGQAYAFLSQDGKTVLKLFKFHHMGFFSAKEKQAKFFQSCKIAFEELRAETGLLYVQLNKTERWKRQITLVDKLGITHRVDLDSLEFALQSRASLALQTVKKLVRDGKKDEAKQAIASILSNIALRCKKGIKDNDSGLKRNMGLIEGQAIAIDIGSFSKKPSLAQPINIERELREKTRRLSRFLEKKAPDLWEEYSATIESFKD